MNLYNLRLNRGRGVSEHLGGQEKQELGEAVIRKKAPGKQAKPKNVEIYEKYTL